MNVKLKSREAISNYINLDLGSTKNILFHFRLNNKLSFFNDKIIIIHFMQNIFCTISINVIYYYTKLGWYTNSFINV